MTENKNEAGDNQASETGKKSFFNRDSAVILIPAALTITFGFLLFAFSIILQFLMDTNEWYQTNIFFPVLNLIVTNLASVLLVLGSGTMVLEFFGFVDYIKKHLTELMVEDNYLVTLSEEKKKRLRSTLQRMILYPNIPHIEANSLFNVVEQQVTPLLTDYYIKEYIVTVDCKFEDDLIKKKIYKKIIFAHIDTNYQKVIDIPLINFQMKRPKNLADHDIVNLCKFEFNGKDYKRDVKIETFPIVNDKYDTQITSAYDEKIREVFKLTNGLAKLETDIETVVGADDPTFIQRVNKPCQNYTIHFNYNPDQCRVMAEGFGFMDSNKFPNERIDYRVHGNSIVIRFNEWILPGNGVIFTILKK